MRYRRFGISGFSTIAFTLCLGVLGSGRVSANPVYADEQSLSNGAQLYEQYCSECHGRETAFLGDSSTAIAAASAEALPPVEEIAEVPAVRGKGEWPAWAKRPDPGVVKEPDVRAQVLSEVAAQMKKAHETAPEQDAPDNAGRFNPIPGATNLADPPAYFYGTSEEEVFNSIADGTGAAMPGWRIELGSDDAMWDLVNYIRSFWGEEWLY